MVRGLLALTAVAHIGFFLAVYALVQSRVSHPAWLALVVALVAYAGFVAYVWNGLEDVRTPLWKVRFFVVPYFVHWTACAFALVPSLLYAIGRPLVGFAVGGRLLPLEPFAILYATGLVVCGYGVLVRRRWVRTEHVEVRIAGLPPAFDGYRVAHLSDLHIGGLTPESWGHAWAARANDLDADMAVITGDMVTSGVDFHEDIARVVGSLRARDGVVVSMGNHDYFGNGEPLIGYLRERGVKVLRNAGFTIARGDEKLHLAAIDDTWTRRADLELALSERPEGVPCVLLAHDPEVFPKAVAKGVDLMLSGHTHGGQLAIPFLAKRYSLATLAHTYNLGIYSEGRSTLYVHPGLGTTGPPIRLGAAPAVTLLTLRAG